jgi:hypothetical protein
VESVIPSEWRTGEDMRYRLCTGIASCVVPRSLRRAQISYHTNRLIIKPLYLSARVRIFRFEIHIQRELHDSHIAS